MQTLIYKRTHEGDPNPKTGVFGNCDCMGSVRGWDFDAVIGIGGVGQEPQRHRIAGKLTWIGIDPKKIFGDPARPNGRGPRVTFRHFLYLGKDGPLLEETYPALAERMYSKNVRVLKHHVSSADRRQAGKITDIDREVTKILHRAIAAPPSNARAKRGLRGTSSKCPPKSRGVRSTSVCRPSRRRNINMG